MLQCRSGKRTGFAAVRIAVDMVREKRIITKEEALLRVDPEALNQLLQPVFDPRTASARARRRTRLTRGLNAGPGRGHRPHRVHRGTRPPRPGREREKRDPGAHRDQPRGHQGHAGLEGHPHRARRHDQPRGARRAADGQGLRRRRRRARDRLRRSARCGRRHDRLREGDWLSLDGTTGEVIAGELDTRPPRSIAGLLFEKGKAQERREGRSSSASRSS